MGSARWDGFVATPIGVEVRLVAKAADGVDAREAPTLF